MKTPLRLSASLGLLALLLAACGRRTEDKCKNVTCGVASVCDRTTGVCIANPDGGGTGSAGGGGGGTFDGGGADGGAVDGGATDGGAPDGGGGGGGTCNPPCGGTTPVCDPADNRCKTCVADKDCSAAKPVCDALAGGGIGECVVCTATAGCSGPMPKCEIIGAARQCVECVIDNDCTGATPYCTAAKVCAAGTGESCSSLKTIEFPAGQTVATFQVDTSKFTDDVQAANCSNSQAVNKEAVFRLVLTTAQDVTIVSQAAAGAPATVDPVLYVKKDPCTGSSIMGCADEYPGTPENLALLNLPPGTYYLFVESYEPVGEGLVDVTVTLTPTTPLPANDSCTGAQALTFNGGVASVSATTLGAVDNNPDGGSPSCMTVDAPDVVFSYNLAAPQDVAIKVTPNGTPALRPAFFIRKPGQCASNLAANEVGCRSINQNVEVSGTFLNQQPGNYFLWVAGRSGSSGPFDMTVTLLPPTVVPSNDNCSGAQFLAFDGGVTAVSGTTYGALHDAPDAGVSSVCNVGSVNSAFTSGPDVVYQYDLASESDVEISVVPTGSTTETSMVPVAYVRKPGACFSGLLADEAGCKSGSAQSAADLNKPISFRLFRQPAGLYSLWVDGRYGTSGPFNLSVKVLAPTLQPSNDTCSGAALILASSSSETLYGTTFGAANEYASDCASDLANSGPDVVYTFTLASQQKFTATVTPDVTDAGLQPYLYLRSATTCASTTGDGGLGCLAALVPGEPTTLVASRLDAGTYFLIVDSFAEPGGPFRLDVSKGTVDAPLSNTACGTPATLALSGNRAVVSGNTANSGSDDSHALCDSDLSQSGQFDLGLGPDVVYKFTTPPLPGGSSGFNARAFLRSHNLIEYTPAVSLRPLCSGDAGVCFGGTGYPVSIAVAYGLQGNVDEYVWVDSANGTAGPFTLSVDVASVPAPNEACGQSLVLTANVSVSGTTLAASDDLQGFNTASANASCPDFLPGPDVVYRYTSPATPGNATVIVTPQEGYDPGIAVLEATCQAASCIGTSDLGLTGGVAESVTFVTKASTVYYLIVDAYRTAAGDPTIRGGFTIGLSQD